MKKNNISYKFNYNLKTLKADINAILKKYGISCNFKKHNSLYESNVCRHHERLNRNEYALFKSQIGFSVYFEIKLEINDDIFEYSEQVGSYSNNNIYVALHDIDLDYFEDELCDFLEVERIVD